MNDLMIIPEPFDISTILWRMKDGSLIALRDMEDKHLRNAALMLMGMGYTKIYFPNHIRVIWLTALRMEWERRIASRGYSFNGRRYEQNYNSYHSDCTDLI